MKLLFKIYKGKKRGRKRKKIKKKNESTLSKVLIYPVMMWKVRKKCMCKYK